MQNIQGIMTHRQKNRYKGKDISQDGYIIANISKREKIMGENILKC